MSAPSMEVVQERRQEWAENRRRVIDRIRVIADELDGWKMESNIANIAGSSMGIVGGGLILGGFIFPPLAIPGIVMSLVGAGGNIGSSIARYNVVKNLAAEAQTLCEEDALLLSAFFDAAENYLQLNAGIGSAAAAATAAIKGCLTVLRRTFITRTNAAGRTSLRAIVPTAAVGPIRAIAGVTAGIGMAIDVFSLITSASSLANDESDELAIQLREIADKLEKELNDVMTENDNSE